MPVIPRVSGPTVGFSPTMQPGTSAEAYAAPGKALQGLGQAVGGLGEALTATVNQDDEYRANLELVKWKNEQDIRQIKSQNDFNGDPRGFANGQLQAFDSSVADLKTRLPNNPKIQQKAALHIEQARGNYNESATKFEYGKTKEQLVADVDATITSEFARIEAGKIETLPDDLDVSIRGINQMIDKAPVPEGAKERLRAASAQMVRSQIERLPPEQRLPAAQRLMQSIQTRGATQAPPGPQSNAAPGAGGIFPVQGMNADLVPRDGGAPNSREHMGPRGGGSHAGWDIPGKVGTPVVAVDSGTVIAKGSGQGYGDYIDVQYADGTVHRMAHLGDQDKGGRQGGFADGVAVGAQVKPGQTLGFLGYSGNAGKEFPHVHYEVFPDKNAYAKAQGMSSRASASLRTNPREYFAAKNGGGAAAGGDAPSGDGIKATLSAYSPQAGGSKMEGGYAASKPGPDGKAEVRTLEDVASGRSPYVTVAGNPSLAGKSYTIPSITFIGTDGKEQTLKNVKAVVHDTGSAFKSAPEGRFDVPIAKDADNALMAKNAGIWSRSGIQFVPEGKGGSVAKAPPVSQRGLTQVAGLTIPGNANDAGPQGRPSVTGGTQQSLPQDMKVAAETTFKASTGKDLPQVQQVASPDGKSGGLSKGQGITVDTAGMTPEEKAATVQAMAKAGYKGFHIAPMSNGDEHVTAYPSDTFKYTGAGANSETRTGPKWAAETFAGLRSASGGPPTVANQASRTVSAGLRAANADSHVLEDLTKHMPAYQAAQQHALEAKIKTIEDRAAKGEIPPPAEVQQLRAMTKDHPTLSANLETTLQGAEYTRAYMQSNPVAVEAKIQQIRGEMNTKGTSQALSVHVAALEKLQSKMDSELKKDPFGWGAEAGVLPVVKPIAPQSILTAQGADLLAERVKISDDLAKAYGEGYRQYFTPTEKTAIVAGLKQGGPAAVGILTQMRAGMGDRMPDAIRELLPEEPEMARAGFLAAYGGDPKAVEAITATFARRQQGKDYKAPKYQYNHESRQTDAKNILGDLYDTQPNAIELDRTMKAAEAIYEHLDPTGTETDGTKWKQAVKMATGQRADGFNVEYGGVVPTNKGWLSDSGKIVIPSTIAKEQFDRLRMDMTKEHLVAAGLPLPATKEGVPLSMGKIATSQLVQAGYGKYYVVTKGSTPADYQYAASIGPDGKPTGQPFVLDMMKLEPVLRKQFPGSYFPVK